MKTKVQHILKALVLASLISACNATQPEKEPDTKPTPIPVTESHSDIENTLKECSVGGPYEKWQICNRFYKQRERYINLLSVLQNYSFRNPNGRFFKALTADAMDKVRAEMPAIKTDLSLVAQAYADCQESGNCTLPAPVKADNFYQAAQSIRYLTNGTNIESVAGYLAPLDSIRQCLKPEISSDPRHQIRTDFVAEACATHEGELFLYSEVIATFNEGNPHEVKSSDVRKILLTKSLPSFAEYLTQTKAVLSACEEQQTADQLVDRCALPDRPNEPFYEVVIDSLHFDPERGFES